MKRAHHPQFNHPAVAWGRIAGRTKTSPIKIPGERKKDVLSALIRLLVIAVIHAGGSLAYADDVASGPGASLRAKYAALQEQLDNSPFQRPLYLDSTETGHRLQGELYGVLDDSFASARNSLKLASQWCDILALHLNVKDCRVSDAASPATISLYVGGKHDEPSTVVSHLDYAYRVPIDTSDYFQILLTARSGPLGTSDYKIQLEATPLDRGRTFFHLSYGYAFGAAARVAMATYLHSLGREKVGFTIVERKPDGSPAYVKGIRGAIERNVMRYYFALVAYLSSCNLPPHEQLEVRLRDWFAFTERHSLQLHELEQNEYLDMKRRQYQQANGR
jgi:hypothetical protein